MRQAIEKCAICGCVLNRKPGAYAKDNVKGRSHASKHHYVAQRFFGHSASPKTRRQKRIFPDGDAWDQGYEPLKCCYDCHEELLHNPVLLPPDVVSFSRLVRERQLCEGEKTESKEKLAGRIRLLHEALALGIERLLKAEPKVTEPLFRLFLTLRAKVRGQRQSPPRSYKQQI
jgi:hypothetical protein